MQPIFYAKPIVLYAATAYSATVFFMTCPYPKGEAVLPSLQQQSLLPSIATCASYRCLGTRTFYMGRTYLGL